MAQFDMPGLEGLSARLRALAAPTRAQVRPLMERWEQIIYTDNRRGVLAGTDRDGHPLAPVKRRSGKYRGATGPPLAPFGERSRAIANLATAHLRTSDGSWVAFGAWDDAPGPVSLHGATPTPYPHIVAFHIRGEGRLPVRDIAGVRPEGVREAETALQDWVTHLFVGA